MLSPCAINLSSKIAECNDMNATSEASSGSQKVITYTDNSIEELNDFIEQDMLETHQSIYDLISCTLKHNPEYVEALLPNIGVTIKGIKVGCVMILFEENELRLKVFKAIYSPQFDENGTKPTNQWLESICKVMNVEQMLSD